MDSTQYAREHFSGDRYAVSATGVKIERADTDYALCSLEIRDCHLNLNNTVMGGAIFTLADYTFGVAANMGGQDTVSLSCNINYLNATIGPKLFAEAKCIKSGRSICFFTITVTEESGKVVATMEANGFRRQ